jgi:HSP20 family protein
MAQATSKVPVKSGEARTPAEAAAHPFDSLRREIDRLFDDVGRGFFRVPSLRSWFEEPLFQRAPLTFDVPAVDVAERDKEYEITAELPGLDEKDIEVNLANGVLTISGEKKEEKEEKKKGYYLAERRYGSFQRSFRVPEGVDEGKIEASFKKGVLKLTLPKTAEAQKSAKKIAIKGS